MGAGAAAGKMVNSQDEALEEAKTFVDTHCDKIWSEMDQNANNRMSVAETHSFIEKNYQKYEGLEKFIDTDTGKCKQPPLIRAWAKVTGYAGQSHFEGDHKDGLIHKDGFKKYIKYCFWYLNLYSVFGELAVDNRSITLEEFQTQVPKFVKDTTPEGLAEYFKTIDSNNGGKLLFDEFCSYIIDSVETLESAADAAKAVADTDTPPPDTTTPAAKKKIQVKPMDEQPGFTDEHKQRIRESFELIDTNKNGTLDKEEFKKAMGSYAEKSPDEKSNSDEELDGYFDTFDVDKDGVITLDEYAHIIHKHTIAKEQ